MKVRLTDPKLVVSGIAGALVALDTFIHPISVIGIVLILCALAPWVGPWFVEFAKSLRLGEALESFEGPGFKLQFRARLKEVAEKSEKTQPPSDPKKEAVQKSLLESLYSDNPELALAGLRVELERRLRTLASVGDGRDDRYKPLKSIVREVETLGRMTADQASLIRDIIPLLNDAIHAKTLQMDTADWAIEVGPPLLAALDEQIAKIPTSTASNN